MRTDVCVFKIIDDHKSELNQKDTAGHKRSDCPHGTEHDSSRDTEKETNIEIGCYNKMDEFSKTCMKRLVTANLC